MRVKRPLGRLMREKKEAARKAYNANNKYKIKVCILYASVTVQQWT